MKNDERAAGAIVLPEERAAAKAASPVTAIEAAISGKRPYVPKEEVFDLCSECAVALLVAFKVRKKEAQSEAGLLGN